MTAKRPPSGRSRIVAAALAAFDRDGYAAVGMSDIRRAAGVSNGSLYHHFASKEQLTAALYLEGLRSYQDGFRHVLELSEPERVIRGGVDFHLRWPEDHRVIARFLLTAPEAAVEAAAPELRQLNRAFLSEAYDWIEARAATGELRSTPPELRYALWIGPAQQVVREWLTRRPRRRPSAFSVALGDAAWRTLRPPR